jgi:hypothetical protein
MPGFPIPGPQVVEESVRILRRAEEETVASKQDETLIGLFISEGGKGARGGTLHCEAAPPFSIPGP